MKTLKLLWILALAAALPALAVNVNVQQPSGVYTDNSIPRRDGTKNLLQASTVLIGDGNDISFTVTSPDASITAFSNITNVTGTTGALTIAGANFDVRLNTTVGAGSDVIGVAANARNLNSSVVNSLIGMRAIATIGASGGNATAGFSFVARSPSVAGAGVITTAYGFYAEQQDTGAGVGAGYAFFNASASDLNYFAGEVQTGASAAGAARINYNLSAYGAGSAYAFTNTAAAIDFGTTDPSITIDKAGTYRITAQVLVAYNGATVGAETATLKMRRTNNTAADVGQVVVIDLPASAALTNNYGVVTLPPVYYTTTNTNDILTIFANVSAALGAGTIDATAVGTSIDAVRLY